MTKQFGDKMEPGDEVISDTWAYTLTTTRVVFGAHLIKAGARGRIVRVVDRNAVVVRFTTGFSAPIHPSALRPA